MSEGAFAVPVPAYRLGIHTARKRKRKSTSTTSTVDAADAPRQSSRAASVSSQHQYRLPSDSINPLSHSPDTLRQFVVAGLRPEDENPATKYPGFPHKALPSNAIYYLPDENDGRGDLGDDGEDSEAESTREKSTAEARVVVQKYSARLKHISNMAAIVHRCLGEGDVPRAKRAFGLLLQTRDVDIKLNNFWLLGSEILMRQGEGQGSQPIQSPGGDEFLRTPSPPSSPPESGSGDDHDHNDEEEDKPTHKSTGRWGRVENAETVKMYFEHLIAQFPHDINRPHLVSAVDFYPALYNFEVYNMSTEYVALMDRLHDELRTAGHDLDDEDDYTSSDEDESTRQSRQGSSVYDDEAEDGFLDKGEQEFASAPHDHHSSRVTNRQHRQFRHEAEDEVRRQTQAIAQQLAANMDRTMETNPYATHPELLRLRANLAIFIADLYLPARIVGKMTSGLSKSGKGLSSERRRRNEGMMKNIEKYLQGPEERVAVLEMRIQEQCKARDLFQKLMKQGVVVEGWVRRFVDMVAEREEYGGDEY